MSVVIPKEATIVRSQRSSVSAVAGLLAKSRDRTIPTGRKVLCAALLVGSASLDARAADVPAHPPVFFDPSAPPPTFAPSFPQAPTTPVFIQPPPPVFDWTGLNLGLNAGYAFDGRISDTLTGTDALTVGRLQSGSVPSQFSTSTSGFIGGLQIGYNKQLDPMLIPPLTKVGAALVLGVEADADYTDLSTFNTVVESGGATTLHGRTEFVGTARGRLGVAFDRLLVYGTGGFAYGGVDNAGTIASMGNSFLGSGGSLRTGYAYGGGLAYAFPATPLFKVFMAPAVTVKLEYIHYNLGSANFFEASSVSGTGDSYNVRNGYSGSLVRAGIDYKFDLKIPPPPY